MLRDYCPYGEINIITAKTQSHTSAENINMTNFVSTILDKYTIKEYFNAKGGMEKDIEKIISVIKKSGVNFEGKKILEFGAGTCKLSATISTMFNVKEIWALDQATNLLKEIAPKIISAVGGDLSKFTFAIGDMNAAFELNEKFDAIVCFGAVHHLYLPEYFFEKLHQILQPGGFVLIVDEPTLPEFNSLPLTPVKKFKEVHFAKKRIGENENAYTISRYKNIFGETWLTTLISTNNFKINLKRWLPINYFMTNYLLKPNNRTK